MKSLEVKSLDIHDILFLFNTITFPRERFVMAN